VHRGRDVVLALHHRDAVEPEPEPAPTLQRRQLDPLEVGIGAVDEQVQMVGDGDPRDPVLGRLMRKHLELDPQRVARHEAVLGPAVAVGDDRLDDLEPAVAVLGLLARLDVVTLAEGTQGVHGRAVHDHPAVLQHDHPVAELAHLVEPMGHEHDGAALALELLDALHALALEGLVTDRQHLVDQQDVRVDVDRHGERQAHGHAARVELHLRVDELLDAGEINDRIEVGFGLPAGEPEDRRVQVDVLAPGQVAVEAGAELQQGGEPAAALDVAGVRGEDPADHREQGALARAVGADEPERLGGLELERHALQRPELLHVLLAPAHVDESLLERLVLVDRELLGDVVHADDRRGHVLPTAPVRSCPGRV
jgi:hypothetical protein